MSVEEDIQKLKAMQQSIDEQVRMALGLISEADMAKVLQFETTEAFTAWRKRSDAAPPCVVLDGRVYYMIDQLRAWLPKEFTKQNKPEPNMTTPPGNTRQETREEFVPPPQRREYGKAHLTPMDLDNNRYKTAHEEKMRQQEEDARELYEKMRQRDEATREGEEREQTH